MNPLPTGTVTILFTDIEGSTERWERERHGMREALARHDAILRGSIESHAGHVFKTVGDAFCAVFSSPEDAVEAAISAQRALEAERFQLGDSAPLRVRMGIHTGLPELSDGDYFGRPVNRVARLMSAGHGGQVLLSLATQQLVRDALPAGCELVDLGIHRLKDLEHSEHLYRLQAHGMPAVDTPPDTAERLGAGERAKLDYVEDAACPYRGLHAFQEEDAPYFFGRESFTELLVESIASQPMLGVIGASGSGKSSVVQAGLVPRMRADASDQPWTVAHMRPGSRPFHALAGALVPLIEPEMSRTDRLVETVKLAEALEASRVSLHQIVSMARDATPDLGRLFLVADQFEELYTLCTEERVKRGFQDLLFESTLGGNGSGPALWLALTLRADFMGHALAYRPFADAIQRHDVKLGPMNREELGRVITKPAELQGRAFEPGLVERILEDVGEKPGGLPLLEFALTKLWEGQREGWLTHEAYEAIGHVEGAVARHADAVYGSLDEAESLAARRVFVQLVKPGEGTEDTRRIATRDEIDEDWPLVRRLADARLVVTNRDEDGHETVEVVHEALIRSWQQLRSWMNADRRFRRWQERLRFGMRQWERAERDAGALLRGAPLTEAEAWKAERESDLAPAELNYVQASIDERDRREAEREARRERELETERQTARKMRRRAYGMAGALVISAGMAVLALIAQQEAREGERLATSRELASAAASNFDRDPELSVLLAYEAVSTTFREDRSVLPEAWSELHRALDGSRVRATSERFSKTMYDVRFSPGGDLLVAAARDGTLRFLDPETGRTRITRPFQSLTGAPATTLGFSPDGSLLVVGALNGSLLVYGVDPWLVRFKKAGVPTDLVPDEEGRLFDPANEREVEALSGHSDRMFDIEFSPDGEVFASASRTGRVELRSSATGELIYAYEAGFSVYDLSINADGTLLAIGRAQTTPMILDLETGDEIRSMAADPSITWLSIGVAFNPDGTQLASSGGTISVAREDGSFLGQFTDEGLAIRIWDVESGEELLQMRGKSGFEPALAYLRDGAEIVSVSLNGLVHLWDARTGRLLEDLPGLENPDELSVHPDGERIAISGGGDHIVRVLDMGRAGEHVVFEREQEEAGVTFEWGNYSPNGDLVAGLTSPFAALSVWDSATGALRLAEPGECEDCTTLALDFSPDGKWLAALHRPDTIRVLDTNSLKEAFRLSSPGERFGNLQFSTDSRLLAGLGSRGGSVEGETSVVIVWDLEQREERYRFEINQDFAPLAFSPDGSVLVTLDRANTDSDANFVRRFDAATGEMLDRLQLPEGAKRLDWLWYDADGRLLARFAEKGETRVWDLDTREVLYRLPTEATGLVEGTQSRWVATKEDTEPATLWGSGDQTLLFSLPMEESGRTIGVIAHPSRDEILVSDSRGMRSYLASIDDLMELARSRITRPLSDAECRKYLHQDSCSAEE